MYGCPVELALDLLGGKWKTIILARIKEGALRYGELRRFIPELSDKVLTERLAELAEDGLVERLEADGQVRYELTVKGRSLEPALQSLYDFGELEAREMGVRFRPVPAL